jgi:putative nucleotidyltransferase with HDIG domain
MSLPPFACPSPPDFRVNWQVLDQQFEWIRAMKDCLQDPVFHGEGDVWIHVRMVCEALASLKEWRHLSDTDRELLFAAALLHDVAKPACTRYEDGRITSRGHSQRGAIQARRILWERGADFEAREKVCALVRYHQAPFYLITRADSLRTAFVISQTARCDLLTIIAKADALGGNARIRPIFSSVLTYFGNSAASRGALIIQEHSRQISVDSSTFASKIVTQTTRHMMSRGARSS